MTDGTQRIVLLNWLTSRSTTRTRSHAPPTIGIGDLIAYIDKRRQEGVAIEFFKSEDNPDEIERLRLGQGHSLTRLADIKYQNYTNFIYIAMLFKYLDTNVKRFSVEDIVKFEGKEIEAGSTEYGVTSAHLMTRLPVGDSQLDLGSHRCVIDYNTPLTRSHIEHFLCRQTRRVQDWSFSVIVQENRKLKPVSKEFKFNPRLELHSDVGRNLNIGQKNKKLSSMLFTKRAERQSIGGKGVEVIHDDVVANVEIKVSANQGPSDPEEKAGWIQSVLQHFTGRGYQVRLYYRQPNGAIVGGSIPDAIAGAADLLMCPKEFLSLSQPIKSSESKVNGEMTDAMKEILDRDELWERHK